VKINSFEEIEVWQKARVFTQEIYKICKVLEKNREFSLSEQIKRASISIMANIAEGFARRTNKEFVQFLFIAKGSAAEVQNYIYVMLDLKFIDENTFIKLKEDIIVMQKMLSGFIKYLRKTI